MIFKNTTKMALQAAIAIAIAELIGWYFHLYRGYWVTLTAMALTMQTWGESLKRSLERISMTVLGGGVGTALYFLLPQNDHLVLSLLLLCVFFTVYLLQIYYLISVFFLTCFVVFLFSLLGEWTLLILRDRILETGLGALIALGVGFFFRSSSSVNKMCVFADFLDKLNTALTSMFQHHTRKELSKVSHQLAKEYHALRKQTLAIRYEFFFHRLTSRDFYLLLNQMAICTQYVIHLVDSYEWLAPYLSQEDREGIAVAAYTTTCNFNFLIDNIQHQTNTSLLSVIRLTEIVSEAIADDPARFDALHNEALGFFNLMYFFTRLNRSLTEINTMLYCVSL